MKHNKNPSWRRGVSPDQVVRHLTRFSYIVARQRHLVNGGVFCCVGLTGIRVSGSQRLWDEARYGSQGFILYANL
jgi:hypothetical protein